MQGGAVLGGRMVLVTDLMSWMKAIVDTSGLKIGSSQPSGCGPGGGTVVSSWCWMV